MSQLSYQQEEDSLAQPYLERVKESEEERAGRELEARYPLQSPQVAAPVSPESMIGLPGQPTPPEPEKTMMDKVGETASAVASDVAKGVTELHKAVAGGVIGSGNELMKSFYDVGDWMREQGIGPDGYLKVGTDGVSWEQGGVPEDLQVQVPNLNRPTSVTGGLVRDMTQWLVGFAGAGKLKPIAAMGASTAGKIGQAIAKGGVADFAFMDEQQKRLSGFLKDTPLENDFSAWVAEGADSPAGNRVKNLVEGLGLGIATEGVLRGLKFTRDYIAAKTPALEAENIYRPKADKAAFSPLGDMDESLIFTRKEKVVDTAPLTAEEKIAAAEKGLTEEQALKGRAVGEVEQPYINFARIDTPEDIKEVISVMSKEGASDIKGAQRGTKSFAETNLDADHVDAWDVLMSRRAGQTLNAEESVAARRLWASSGKTLADTARKAADNPTDANIFAFRKMASVHHAIQQEILGARTETARALSSWRIPAGSDEEMAAALSETLFSRGGTSLGKKMAAQVAAMAEAGQIKELSSFVTKANRATTTDMLQEAWINGLLGHVGTHAVNIVSNASILGLRIGERRIAGYLNNALGRDGSAQLAEASAMYAGVVGGLKDAFRYAGKTFKTNQSQYGYQKFEVEHPHAITSESMGLARESYLGAVVDGLGTFARLPTRALSAEDEFFKTLAYRMELHSLAQRTAIDEVARGVITEDRMKERMAEVIMSPPTSVKLQSADFAQYATFTNTPGQVGQAIQKIAGFGPMKLILPFVRTPANILSYTMERTPFAPLTSKFRQEWGAGGDRRRIAEAQVAIGTGVMLISMDAAMNDLITGSGPKNVAERQHFFREGKKPFSIKIGDQYYQYNRLDPFGMQIGIAATIADIVKNSEDEGVFKATEQAMVASVLAIGNNVLSKTYMQGVSNLFNAFADPDRYGMTWAQSLAGSMVPTMVGRAARVQDPYLREVHGMLDAIQNRIPGLSENLPPKRDLWGRAVSVASGNGWAYDFLSPIAASQYKPEPIDDEMSRLGAYTPTPPQKVSFSGGGGSSTVNLEEFPGAYSRYLELAGNGVKDLTHSKGCMDYLNDVVTGKAPESPIYNMYSDGEDGMKAVFIAKTISAYRDLAKRQLLVEYPEIRAKVNVGIEKSRGLKMPSQE